MLRKKKRGVERERTTKKETVMGGGSRARGRLMFESQFESHLWG